MHTYILLLFVHSSLLFIYIPIYVVEAISVAGALKGVNNAIEYKDAIGVISYLFNNWQLFRLNSR